MVKKMSKKNVVKKSFIVVLFSLTNGVISFLFAQSMSINRNMLTPNSLIIEMMKKWALLALLMSGITAFLYRAILQKMTGSKPNGIISFIMLVGLWIVNMLVFTLNVKIIS